MTTQHDFFDGPVTRARRTDPETSKAAASSVTNLRASQARILAMFRLYGDMHDKQLEAYLHDAERSAGIKPMSPSGIRSRRSELSKPNMDRLDEIMAGEYARGRSRGEVNDALLEDWARKQLHIEGFRSHLWDTGKRAVVDGRTVIVWGIAQ